jgi:two-component system chemotaxis response regulator CheB
VKQRGGTSLVQDPEEALHPSMPASAIERDAPDAVLPVEALAERIVELERARQPVAAGRRAGPEEMPGDTTIRLEPDPEPDLESHLEPEPAPEDVHLTTGAEIDAMQERYGPPTGLTCPECGGALWPADGDRLGCHVGHRYGPATLAALQGAAVENALWTAVRALEERAEISERLLHRARHRGDRRSSRFFEERVLQAREQAAQVRRAARTLATQAAGDPG